MGRGFMIGFDPVYLLFIAPAVLLAAWAQMRVKSAYAAGMQEPSQYSGADVARAILDEAGLTQIPVEETPGELSDHYDPASQTVRLSSDVYHSYSLAAVGIAAHEVGHALQHAHSYAPMGIRNLAVGAAIWAPNLSLVMIFAGLFLHAVGLIWLGIATFSLVVVFQLVNLPVEFDASNRAKRILPQLGMVDAHGSAVVANVLNAAAWTYVAATLQAVLTLLYYAFRFGGIGRREDDY
jgi:Zn-dependent membrane protease YugP